MAAAAVAPWPLGLTGWIFGGTAAVLGVLFVGFAIAVARNDATEPKIMGPEKRLFAFSILYLFVLFASLVADRWLLA
jgi:protoheme IX farnesyltransferase